MADDRNEFFQTDGISGIFSIMDAQKSQQISAVRAQCLAAWNDEKHLDKKELEQLGWLGPEAKLIVREHPFAPTDAAISQIKEAFDIHKAARDVLVKAYGHFSASIQFDLGAEQSQIASSITQSIFQFVFSTEALVQAYRRLKSVESESAKGIDLRMTEIFTDSGLREFVKKLRNCYGHQKIIIARPRGTTTVESKAKTRTTECAIEFNKVELLAINNAWNKEAQQFIEENETLDALDIVDRYYKCSAQLYNDYLAASGIVRSYGFREFARCRTATTTISQIMWLGILLQNAKSKGVDPYSHLANYFTESECTRIFCFQAKTREQVDFMIGLRDPLGLCDDGSRQKLYELFCC